MSLVPKRAALRAPFVVLALAARALAQEPATPTSKQRPEASESLQQAAEIERAAQEACTALVSQIRSRDYVLSAAFILVDEVRHLTVWRRVLGLKIY